MTTSKRSSTSNRFEFREDGSPKCMYLYNSHKGATLVFKHPKVDTMFRIGDKDFYECYHQACQSLIERLQVSDTDNIQQLQNAYAPLLKRNKATLVSQVCKAHVVRFEN